MIYKKSSRFCKNFELTLPKKITPFVYRNHTMCMFTLGWKFYRRCHPELVSAKEFIEKLFNTLPKFFKSEDELREIWSKPETRKQLLEKLKNCGFSIKNFDKIKEIINAPNSDIFDVLTYIAYSENMITRKQRVDNNKILIFDNIQSRQRAFIDFVLKQYIKNEITELDDNRIGALINLKYGSPANAVQELGNIQDIRNTFCDFQKYLYK